MDKQDGNKKASNNIADARRRYEKRIGDKYTQEDAAKDFGVSISTYRNYEQEKSLPDGFVAAEMAKKYGVSVDYLMGITEYAFVNLPETHTDDEKEILDLYRSLPEVGKRMVLAGLREYAKNNRE